MEKKKYILLGVLFLIIGIAIGYGGSYIVKDILQKDEPKKEEPAKDQPKNEETIIGEKYYIKFCDESIPGITYTLEMDKEGVYNLEVYHASSAVDVKPTTNQYQDKLDALQLTKVKVILNSINKDNRFSDSEYAFKYDYNTSNINLTSSEFKKIDYTLNSIENIARKTEKIGEQTREEFGNEFLDEIHKKVEEETKEIEKGYRKITFIDFINYSNSEVSLKQDEKLTYKYENNKVYINSNITNIESDSEYLYTVDIDEDNIDEIITKTSNKGISPITNYYHIYKYENNIFKEIATIEIIGSIDYFYIKDKDIKVIYTPFESKPGTIGEEHFTINS